MKRVLKIFTVDGLGFLGYLLGLEKGRVMSLSDSLKKLKFDTRLTEWYMKNNLLTQDELKKVLETLPDVSANIDISSEGDSEVSPDETH